MLVAQKIAGARLIQDRSKELLRDVALEKALTVFVNTVTSSQRSNAGLRDRHRHRTGEAIYRRSFG